MRWDEYFRKRSIKESRLKTANKNLLATVLNFAESAPDALSLHEFALVLTVKAGIHYEEVVHYIV